MCHICQLTEFSQTVATSSQSKPQGLLAKAARDENELKEVCLGKTTAAH